MSFFVWGVSSLLPAVEGEDTGIISVWFAKYVMNH